MGEDINWHTHDEGMRELPKQRPFEILGPRLPAGVVAKAFKTVVPPDYEWLTNTGNEFATTLKDLIYGPPQAGEDGRPTVQGMMNLGYVGVYKRKEK